MHGYYIYLQDALMKTFSRARPLLLTASPTSGGGSQKLGSEGNRGTIDGQGTYPPRYGRSVLNLRACDIILSNPPRKRTHAQRNTPISGFKCSQTSRYNSFSSVLIDTEAEEGQGMAYDVKAVPHYFGSIG